MPVSSPPASADWHDWFRHTRKRLGVNQSDISSLLTFTLKQSVSQGRISEVENRKRSFSPFTRRLLTAFLREVEELKREGKNWRDHFKM